MEFVEVMRCRQIMNIGENLKTFNFDLAQTLIHRIYGRVVGGCVVPVVVLIDTAARPWRNAFIRERALPS
jgi:hypothetical protein